MYMSVLVCVLYQVLREALTGVEKGCRAGPLGFPGSVGDIASHIRRKCLDFIGIYLYSKETLASSIGS